MTRVLAVRDFKVKFKQALIGPLWLVIQPIALLVAFAIGFGNVVDVETGVPYSLFVLVAITAWTYFSITFNMGVAVFVTNIAAGQADGMSTPELSSRHPADQPSGADRAGDCGADPRCGTGRDVAASVAPSPRTGCGCSR